MALIHINFYTELLPKQRLEAILEKDPVQSGWIILSVKGLSPISPSVVIGAGAITTVIIPRMLELSATVSIIELFVAPALAWAT